MLDRATLPQPMSPPSTTTPMSIEFIGPAPGSGASEPLFGSLPSGEVIITPPPAPSTAPLSGPAQDEAPGASPRTPPPPEVADFVVPSAGLSERIDVVARWTCTRLGTEEVLLVDDFGDVLWGGREHTALVLSVMMAWHTAQRASAESATHDSERIDKELAHGRWLTALRVPTSYGTVRLAAICRESVRDEDARVIRAALVRAVEGSPPG